MGAENKDLGLVKRKHRPYLTAARCSGKLRLSHKAKKKTIRALSGGIRC